MRASWIVAAVMCLPAVVGTQGPPQANSLVGAWRVAEMISPQGERNANPQPTIYIFTARHYSHVSVTSAAPRPSYAGPDMTDAQRVAMWEPFTATAGTYEVRPGEFTIRPVVAKNPAAMASGSFRPSL